MKSEQSIWHKGGCHCGGVVFEVRAPRSIKLTACNCSVCEMTGYQHLIVEKSNFRLLSDANNLTTYTFNTHVAKHTFCKVCGIKSFYTPRSHPDGISVNFRCLDRGGFNTADFEDFDGKHWEANVDGLRNKT